MQKVKGTTSIGTFALGSFLLKRYSEGKYETIQTSKGEVNYAVVPGLASIGQYGCATEDERNNPMVMNREGTLVVNGIFAITDLPSRLIPPVLVHELTEANTGNHFEGIIAEVEEARRAGVHDELNRLVRTRNFGLSTLVLHQILVDERFYKDKLKIRGLLMEPGRFLSFLRACRHPEAKKDLETISEDRTYRKLTFQKLRRLGYGRFPTSRDLRPFPGGERILEFTRIGKPTNHEIDHLL